MRKNTVVCAGYARLPENTTAGEVYKIIGIGIEVDPVTEVILNADVTLATELGRQFVRDTLIGRSVRTDQDAIVAEIDDRYYGAGRKAIAAAFKDACAQYAAYLKDHNKGTGRAQA